MLYQVQPCPVGWVTETLRAIVNSPAGATITSDMQRAADIALKLAAGEVWDAKSEQWVKPEPIAYADKIAFMSAMATGKGCDVWPKAGDYTERTGRELVAVYLRPVNAT